MNSVDPTGSHTDDGFFSSSSPDYSAYQTMLNVLVLYIAVFLLVKYFNPKFTCFRIRTRHFRCEWDGLTFRFNVNVGSSLESIDGSLSSSTSLIGRFISSFGGLFSRLKNSTGGTRNVKVREDSKIQSPQTSNSLTSYDNFNNSFYDKLERGNTSSIMLTSINPKNSSNNEHQDERRQSSTSLMNNNILNKKDKLPIEMQWRKFQLQQKSYQRRRRNYNACIQSATGEDSSTISKMIHSFYSIGVYIFFCFQLVGILFLLANLLLTLTRSNFSPLFHPASFGDTDEYGRGIYDIEKSWKIEDPKHVNHRMLSSVNEIPSFDITEKENINLLRDLDFPVETKTEYGAKKQQKRILSSDFKMLDEEEDYSKAAKQDLLELNVLDLSLSSQDQSSYDNLNQNEGDSLSTSGTRYIVTTLKPLLPNKNNLPGGWFLLWVCVLIALVIHEIGHGFVAYLEGCPLKSFGLSLYAIIPGAYVHVDESVQFLSPFSQLKIYCAGVWHNFALAFILYLLLSLTMSLNNIPSIYTNHSPEVKKANPTTNLRGPHIQPSPSNIRFPFMEYGDEIFSIQDRIDSYSKSEIHNDLQAFNDKRANSGAHKSIPSNTFVEVISSIQEKSKDRRNKFEDILNLAIDPEVDTAVMVNRWVLEDNTKAFQDFGLLQTDDKFYPLNIITSPDADKYMDIDDFREEIASHRKKKSSLDCCNLQSLLSWDSYRSITDSGDPGYGCFAVTDNTEKIKKEYLSCLPVSSTLSLYTSLKYKFPESKIEETSIEKHEDLETGASPGDSINENILSTSFYLQPITIPPQSLMKIIIKREEEYLMFPFQGNLLAENYFRYYSQNGERDDTNSTGNFLLSFCIFLNMLIHVSLSIGAINLIPALQLDGAHASLQFLLLFYRCFSPKVQKEKLTSNKDLNGGTMDYRSKTSDLYNLESYGHPYVAINIDTVQQENAFLLQRIKRLNRTKRWHNWIVALTSFLLIVNIIFAMLSLIL